MSTTGTAIIAEAKRLSGLTWAQFDFALSAQGGLTELDMAVGRAACAVPGDGTTHSREREHELWAEVNAAVEDRKATARARGFVGWSSASRGPVRYADEVR
jgi:hypothetical protein